MTDAETRGRPNLFTAGLQIIYGLYAITVFLVFGLSAFVLVLLPLGIQARRHIAHFAARAFRALRRPSLLCGRRPADPGDR
jgi:1-acyl-sn-glycerol-3-phosphate acyltransferase